MATTFDTTPLLNELVLDYRDIAGETGRVTIALDGTTTNANLVSIVDDIRALSNALITPKVLRTYQFTGSDNTGLPANGGQNLIAALVALQFEKANPINPAGRAVSKQVPILAYLDAIRNNTVKPHVPVTNNATLNALIALLEAHLQFIGANGTAYPGGFTYNPASKFGTKLTITDGL